MKRAYRTISTILIIGLSIFVFSSTVNAQFFDKLTKGLEKVNKALDKVEETINPNEAQKDNKSAGRSVTSPQQKAEEKNVPSATTTENENIPKVTVPQFNTPHLTDSTRLLLLDADEYQSNFYHQTSLTDVSEGIFGIRNKFGEWSFFDAETGQCIFPRIGKALGSGHELPHFDNGVALVKARSGNKDVYKLLYADGRVKQLDGNYAAIEDFVDGVSMAKTFDGKYIPSIFYIDINGNKIYPSLSRKGKRMGDMLSTTRVRPLCDGLRAIKIDGKWGYIDSKGVVKIQPQFISVRDFSEGYAWVTAKEGTEYKIGLIDTKGQWSIAPKYKGYNMEISSSTYGDAHSGRLRVIEGGDLVYYDTSGTEIKRIPGAKGTSFTDGYAYVSTSGKEYVINTDIEPVKVFSEDNSIDITNETPNFKNYPLAIVNHQRAAITPDGKVAIAFNPSYNLELRDFSKDGYAYAETVFDDETVRGFIRPDGAYTVVISMETDKKTDLELAPIDTIGPITLPTAKYTVTTIANPPEGGSVSAGTSVEYGESYTITATPNNGWKLASIKSSSARSYTNDPTTFNVYEDLTLTANFIKKDEIKPTETGVWSGNYHITYMTPEGLSIDENIPIYLELKSDKSVNTPLGNKYGILTLIFDAEKVYRSGEVTNTHGGHQCQLMYIPMTVEGKIEIDGKEYLLIEGGQFKIGNILVEDGLKDGGLNAFAANIFLYMFGNDLEIGQGSYLLEISKNGDNITLGSMKRFHTDYGWLDAGDERFTKLITSGIIWGFDSGLPANFFDKQILTPTQERDDVMWYVPKSWLRDDEDSYRQMKEKFDRVYKGFISDYFKLWKYE